MGIFCFTPKILINLITLNLLGINFKLWTFPMYFCNYCGINTRLRKQHGVKSHLLQVLLCLPSPPPTSKIVITSRKRSTWTKRFGSHLRPWSVAKSKQFLPVWSVSVISAPFDSSNDTISAWPSFAARCRGVVYKTITMQSLPTVSSV